MLNFNPPPEWYEPPDIFEEEETDADLPYNWYADAYDGEDEGTCM